MPPLPTLLVQGSSDSDRSLAPIEYITTWIKNRMPEFGHHSAAMADRVLIVRAETGSGKSTVLPVAVFRILRSEKTPASQKYRGPSVLCTQPRVLTAIALANDVDVLHSPWNRDIILGETVGYQTGPISNRPPAGLMYATAGVLAVQLRTMEDAEIINLYRFIIIDEAHERSLDGDVTLMLLKNFYDRNTGNPRLPFLLLTSATFDTGRYAEYFGVGPGNVVEVTGRAYAIETHWPKAGTNDYPAEAAAVALRIHEEFPDDPPEKADILIFMPGAPEMLPVVAALTAALKRYAAMEEAPPPFLVLMISRDIINTQSGDYPLVFEKPARLPKVEGRHPSRRIIISTVVAETGLTIDTLRHVIDCGWSRTRETYQPQGAEGIITRPAPQSRIRQRKGRAGRLFDGHFWPLYTENVFNALEIQQLPEIITAGSAETHLAVMAAQQRQDPSAPFRIEEVSLLDPPPAEAFLAANATATALGFVSVPGLTSLGQVAAIFSRCSMEGVAVLLAGYRWEVAASDLITAVVMFGIPKVDLLVSRGRKKAGTDEPALPPGSAALRASLPGYIATRIGGGVEGILPPSESEEFYFRARLLIADDFVEGVLIFSKFAQFLDGSEGDVAEVAAWCADLDLNFDTLIDIARKRDSLQEEMITAGLNPFRLAARQLSGLPAADFTEGLRKFKQCLYAGLRGRLLKLDGSGYVTLQDMRVRVPALLSDAMRARLRALGVTKIDVPWTPRWLLTDQIRLQAAPKREGDAGNPLLYVAEANVVSILDGYVDPDLDFGEARMF